MDTKQTNGIQTILNKIDTLAQRGTDGNVEDGALEQYINTLMEEKNFPSLSPSAKEQFRQKLLTTFKEYIAAKKAASPLDQNKSTFLSDTFAEFKDVYQGLIPFPGEHPAKSEFEDQIAKLAQLATEKTPSATVLDESLPPILPPRFLPEV